MSAIKEIYESIANMTVGSVKARNITEIKLAVKQVDLPMRMLVPRTTGDLGFVGIGDLNQITWVIRDLCLWAPLAAGSGIQQFAESMQDYLVLYIAEIKANRNPTAQSVITGVAFDMTPTPWADNHYWSIDITLTVDEVL